MLILGIDPGSRHTGFGVVESHGDRLEAKAQGRFSCPASWSVPKRLARLCRDLEALLQTWQPDVAALETPYHGLNSHSLVVLAEARGALLATLANREIEIAEYSPAEVKSAVSGNGRAGKDQVERMVRLHLALRDIELTVDASDALAVAICYAHRRRIDQLNATQKVGRSR